MPNSRKSKSHIARRSKTKSKSRNKQHNHSRGSSKRHAQRHSRASNARKHSRKHSKQSSQKRKISVKADPELWRKSVKKAMHKFNDKRSARMYQNAVHIYKSEGGKFIGPKSPDNSLQRWSREYKDEPKSLKSKVNRILKNDSGRIRMMRKFT